VGNAWDPSLSVGGGPIIPPPEIGGGPIVPPEPIEPPVTPPQPGDPVTVVPGDHPVAPIVPPPFIIVDYPGVGPVVVPIPASATPKK
jgi:hypothetical protein